MKISKRLAALPLTALVTLASAQRAPTPADEAAAARANAEQNQQIQQQRNAQQREQTVSAPAVRSGVPKPEVLPTLPHETPCFRIDTFALDAPATLPMSSASTARPTFRVIRSGSRANRSTTTEANASANARLNS